jgi:hypothetical protein
METPLRQWWRAGSTATLRLSLTSVPSCFCDVIAPAPTEGNIEDRDFPNISAAAAIEYGDEGA